MSVASGNWTNGSLGPLHWCSMESPWAPLSSLQILALLLGVVGPFVGVKGS